jgi:hypothetical protein
VKTRNLQKLAGDFISHRISTESWLFQYIEALILLKNDRAAQVKIAQAMFFMAPEPGDGE